MKAVLYVRVESSTHRLLAQYAASRRASVSDVVNELVAELLFQVCPAYEPPPWLTEAVERGDLPITRCPEPEEEADDEEGEAVGSVVHFQGYA